MLSTRMVILGAALLIFGCGGDDGDDTIGVTLIDVQGTALDIGAYGSPVAEPVTVAALSSSSMGSNMIVIAATTSSAAGAFSLTDVDVTTEMALLLFTDDASSTSYSFDSETAFGGTYYPASTTAAPYSPVQGITPAKEDISGAFAYVLSNTLVSQLATTAGQADIAATGFVLGIVMDGVTHTPIGGATARAAATGTSFEIAYPTNGPTAAQATQASGWFLTHDSQLMNATGPDIASGRVSIAVSADGYVCPSLPAPIQGLIANVVIVPCRPQ